MAENTNAQNKFVEFLESTPEMLVDFVRIINEFYKLQGEAPAVVKQEDGPKTWKAGETHELTTVGISNEDLDAVAKGYASAIVKEKAIEFAKGFLAGLMVMV